MEVDSSSGFDLLSGSIELVNFESFLDSLTKVNFTVSDGLATVFDYAGTSPSVIFEALLECKNKMVPISDGEFFKDLCMMVMIMLKRGSNWEKIYVKTHPEGQSIMHGLKERYNIRSRATGYSVKAITLPRVCSVVPHMVMKIASMTMPRVVIEGVNYTSPKHFLSLPGAAGAVPKALAQKQMLLNICIEYQEELSKVVNKPGAPKQLITAAKIVEIQHNGPLSEANRIKAMNYAGIMVGNVLASGVF